MVQAFPRLRRVCILAALALPVVAGIARAQPASQPEGGALAEGPLKIVVTGVQGGAQYRPEGEKKWQALTIGAELPEGVELRTGPKGAIQFKVLPDQVYRVDRLTAVKVLRANLSGGTIKTDVGLTYGRVSKDLDAPARPHDDTVVSPSSTLAVRGTRVSLYDQPPYTPEAVSLTGRAVFETNRRQRAVFGAKGEGTAKVTANNPDAATTALNTTIVDPSFANARSPAEQKLLADLISRGALVTYDTNLGIPVVRGGTVPSVPELKQTLPGDVVLGVQWSGNTDVNLAVSVAGDPTHPAGEFAYPLYGFNNTPTGGRIPFDHRGGPNGGFEYISYPTSDFPLGGYSVIAVNNGNAPAHVRIFGTEVTTAGQRRSLLVGSSAYFGDLVYYNRFFFNLPPQQTVGSHFTVGPGDPTVIDNSLTQDSLPLVYATANDPNSPITPPGIQTGNFSVVRTAASRSQVAAEGGVQVPAAAVAPKVNASRAYDFTTALPPAKRTR